MTEPEKSILGKTVRGSPVLVDADVIAKDGGQHHVGKPTPAPVKAEKVYHVEYELKQRFSTEELRSLVQLAQRELPSFELRTGEPISNAELYGLNGPLSKFVVPTGLTMAGVNYVEAKFKPKSDPAQEITDILQSALESFEHDMGFITCCLFKARGFEQNKKPEECGLHFNKGKFFVDYNSEIQPTAARKEYFSQLIPAVGLPLELVDSPRGFFQFKHTSESAVGDFLGGVHNVNPERIRCAMAVSAASELTPFIRAILNTATAVVGANWTGLPGYKKHFSFDSIVGRNFPCESVDLGFNFAFDNNIMAVLEALRTMKRKSERQSGSFQTCLAKFKLLETEGSFHVVTTKKGHRLNATVIRKVLPELNRILNVNFTPSSR
ncbi:MAG: hypothetical protein HY298_27800 [Verrucomicrobia bacterium]|nr:hypothetical protein [Verrucomicrobiota bacterium]